MAEGAGGHGVLVHSSVASPNKLAKSAGNSVVFPRSLSRSNHTCFHMEVWDKHSGAEPCGEWGYQNSMPSGFPLLGLEMKLAKGAMQLLIHAVWVQWAWGW